MHEEEFDSLAQKRGLLQFDGAAALERMHRLGKLWLGLWGRTAEDLERQLLAPHPAIPQGIGLADLRELQRSLMFMMEALKNPKLAAVYASSLRGLPTESVLVGAVRMSAWEARVEILRRAITYLEDR